jgi:acetyl/propionyl-CoA carboxylase alpha subunit
MEIVIDGINTNLQLHRDILDDAAFQAGGTDIYYLERKLGRHVQHQVAFLLVGRGVDDDCGGHGGIHLP